MFKRSKFLICSAALVLTTGILAGNAFAVDSTTTTGVVNVSTRLNVRSSYSTSAPIVGTLAAGSKINIIYGYNGWYEINYNGQNDWVSGSYITGINTSGVTNSQIKTALNAADSAIGVKYVYGGATMNGFDCSGLAVYAYAKAGVTLPHSSSQQATVGTAVSKTALQPGDLLFFDTTGAHSQINHVGIYLGNGLFVQAESGLGYVTITSMNNSYWSNTFITARRVIS